MYLSKFSSPTGSAASRSLELDAAMSRSTNKSLTVGSYGAGDRSYGPAFVREQLDDFILTLQEDTTQLKLMPALYKQPCPGPTFKYDVIDAWGTSSPYARAQREIARPLPDQAVTRQVVEQVKNFGITGQVSFQALNTETIVDPMTIEVRSNTMKLLKDIEEMLYTGDSSLNPLMFDGYRTRMLKQSPAYNIIDCHGRPPTLDQVDEILAILRDRPNLAEPNVIHFNYKAHARFNREYVPQGRFDFTDQGTRTANFAFDRYKNIVGDVEMVGTSFITAGSRGLISAAQDPLLAPANPTVSAPQVGPASGGIKSNFFDSDAGAYFLFVQAENARAVSSMVQVGSGAVNVAAGDVISFNITAGASGRTDCFRIFATKKNQAPVISDGVIVDANAWEIGAVRNVVSNMGAVPVPYVVTNSKMPGTTEGYVFDTRQETMFWISQLALGKTDLAITQTAQEFMLNIIGCPALRAPTRVALFTNVGDG